MMYANKIFAKEQPPHLEWLFVLFVEFVVFDVDFRKWHIVAHYGFICIVAVTSSQECDYIIFKEFVRTVRNFYSCVDCISPQWFIKILIFFFGYIDSQVNRIAPAFLNLNNLTFKLVVITFVLVRVSWKSFKVDCFATVFKFFFNLLRVFSRLFCCNFFCGRCFCRFFSCFFWTLICNSSFLLWFCWGKITIPFLQRVLSYLFLMYVR